MNKKLISMATMLLSAFFLYAKPVSITFEFADGERLVKEFDDTKETFVIWTGDSNDSVPSKELTDIKGLENWQVLEAVEFYGIKYYGDWHFLKDIKNLKGFFVNYFYCKSLRFLEDLVNLEDIELEVWINKKDSKDFEKEEIDLSKLSKIKTIALKAFYISEDIHSDYRLTRIPNFINVQNHPVLDVNNNHIKELTKHDKKLLIQYSKVYFYSNSITADRDKLEEEFREIEFVW